MKLRPRGWSFLALAVLIAAACVRLGFWQLSRLAERRAHNQMIEARLAMPVADLQADASAASEQLYRRIRASGTFDADHEVLLENRTLNDQPGVHLITPLLLEGQLPAVLVDRGWVALENGAAPSRGRYRILEQVNVEGVLRPSQPEPSWAFLADPTAAPDQAPLDSVRVLNVERIQAQTPYTLLPVVLELTAPTQPGMPIPNPDLDLSDGPHLGYAIQWFLFAVIALAGGLLYLKRAISAPAAVE